MRRTVCAVFDIDDTLYLERDYVRSGFEAAGNWAAMWLRIDDFAERCWSSFMAGRRNRIFDEVLRESGKEPAAELISALVEIYRTHTPNIALATDAAEALGLLARTALIAVVSDGPAVSQSRKAEALGLTSFAAPILLTEVMGRQFCKPHARAFEQVQECRPADVYIYVADNPLKDFVAPKRLGWATVRLRRPGGLHYAAANSVFSPDYEMADCSGLPEVLAQLS
jgi:putative hydrolase of the HAD superfamily